ncbi:isoleucine--tRNA ligase [Youxingia wuxianensis]|uniref:Isoleucine--tRNA ligase n=1 Tax=Youxingia wuxianensis TaxID=2763678 RepID=A0A926IH45_9FIRM|nr:isoleucine--tRNA ligase [Youxingia wuxianensis]MBC8584338.1 isoleucine--tRNA ligase [Youxingia wuxianensis]
MSQQQDYSKTLNLPNTEFSMRAGLPAKEPEMVANWEKQRLYYKMVENNKGKPLFVLHDGPPYANANIHMGTALNKVLKDIIVRRKNLCGYQSPYIPGWDTHGLPIELKALKELGATADISPIELRHHCRDFALRFVENQKEEFQRLGTLADYDNPYLTLRPEFEARQIEIFGEMANKGYIYKGLKPVYWCPTCVTALAEAEIEYSEDKCYSIYVKFNAVQDRNGVLARMGAADLNKTYFVIWTTTTWTLPGNMAICLGPEYEYCVVLANGEYYVMAKELVASTMKAAKIENYEILGSAQGKELEYCQYRHPFMERISPIIVGDHVTLESGTGCVHTAPGHGVEDFEVCTKHYPEIETIVPVDNLGNMTELAGEFAGLTTDDANKAIAKKLEELGSLFAIEKIIHQYPHCWRCKDPIIFRATEQWFCSIDDIKDQTIKALDDVEFIPPWGKNRMVGMVKDRSDWCISRQRTWGVPIPIFYCKKCGKYHVDEESIQAVSKLFREKGGSDAWYTTEAEDILPKGTKCKYCGATEFTKETDIMDVWFDSGVTHASVLYDNPDLKWPCDLYLEGTDQYRGWFQSSLLTSIAWKGVAPYKSVCTHGWVVDGEGRKMSKSLGNGMEPSEITDQYGADILRLWVASSDYHADIRISKDILKQLSEVYRKIRNTARYILGNISDFDPQTDMVSFEDLTELDQWALAKFNELVAKLEEAYDNYEFHIIYHALHNFCTIDMSNFYLDVIKDRLYVEGKSSQGRRAAQTTIYTILRGLTLLFAPILCFTAEEIWKYMPQDPNYNSESVMFNEVPKAKKELVSAEFMYKWDHIHEVRDDVNKALEEARNKKFIGKSLEAKVVLSCEGELYDFLTKVKEALATVFIVSQVEIKKGTDGQYKGNVEGLSVSIEKADGQLCPRCWMYSDTVGSDPKHPDLCARCAQIIG